MENSPSASGDEAVAPSASDTQEATATAPSPQTSSPCNAAVDEPSLSKNQLKKRRRWEKGQANKKRKKDQKRELRYAQAEKDGRDLDAERKAQLQNTKDGKGWQKRQDKWKEILKRADIDNSFRVCFDCSFEDQMTWKEANSLGLQLRYAYAMNRKSTHPVYIDICGLKNDGQTRGHLEKVEGFPKLWVGRAFRCYEGNLEVVYDGTRVDSDDAGSKIEDKKCVSEEKKADGQASSIIDSNDTTNDFVKSDSKDVANNISGEEPHPKLPPNHQFVYLTGDSPNTLTTLDNNTTYIIGGIVDRNRLKRAALDRAETINAQKNPLLNIKTARLPLDENLDFKGSTRVLTCNHVFEILQKFRENGYNDWRSSIMAVLPGRKDVEEKNESKGSVGSEEKDNCVDAETKTAADKDS